MSTKIITTCDICGEEILSGGKKICIKKGDESDLSGRMFDICLDCSVKKTLWQINEYIEDIKEEESGIKYDITKSRKKK